MNYYCKNCLNKTSIERKYFVEEFPEYLVIHVSRFSAMGSKLNNKLRF